MSKGTAFVFGLRNLDRGQASEDMQVIQTALLSHVTVTNDREDVRDTVPPFSNNRQPGSSVLKKRGFAANMKVDRNHRVIMDPICASISKP